MEGGYAQAHPVRCGAAAGRASEHAGQARKEVGRCTQARSKVGRCTQARREVGRCAPLRVLRHPVLAHVEVLDLAHYSSRHIPLFCVEARDVIDAALSRNQVVEEGVGVVPERGDGSKASDDDLRGPAPIRLRVRPLVAARGSVRGAARLGMAPFAAATGPPASRGPQHDLR